MAKIRKLSAKSTRNVKFQVHRRKITRKVERANAKAMRLLAEEMTLRLNMVLNAPGTRKMRSAPGEPPRKQSGDLQADTKVEFDGKGKLIVKTLQYGIYLDGGTSKMSARPFLRVSIHDEKKTWNQRYYELLKSFAR